MAIDLRKYTRQDRIRHADLQGRTVTTTLVGFREVRYDDGDEDLLGIVSGRDGDRSVKLTPTSCKLLQEAWGSKVEDWTGRRVRLSPVSGSTEQYNSIRVEPA